MTLTRESLEALDKPALIELILQLAARLSEQEACLRTLQAQQKTNSKNSSKPPSSDPPFQHLAPTQKSSANQSGGQPGHKGHGLNRMAAPDRVQEHLPLECSHCGCSLEHEPVTLAGSWQVFDLPQDIKIEVVEHRRLARYCPWCEQQNRAALPGWLSEETPCQYGPRCRALAVYLMQQQHLPYERTQALFADLFGSAPSEGTLFCWQQQAYEALEPVEAAIAKALVQSRQVGADETPARGAGWLHCLVSEHFTWYGSHPKRGREAMEAFGLLPGFGGLLMSDCLSSYTIYGSERSLCGAHLLRDLVAVREWGHRWAEQMITLLLGVKGQVQATGAPLAGSTLQAIYRWFGRVLALGRRENAARSVPKSWALLSRLELYRAPYLRFATTEGAWFDNNISERALRMMKLHLKVSGCFRSLLGCRMLCRVRGYLSTMHKQGQPLLAALLSVMEGRPMLPPQLQHAN
jgi:transposase